MTGLSIGGIGVGGGGRLRGLSIGGVGVGAPRLEGVVLSGIGVGGTVRSRDRLTARLLQGRTERPLRRWRAEPP